MAKDDEMPINNRRVLEVFSRNPNKQLTYDDLKGLREHTTESRIREALRALVCEKVLIGRNPRGKPRAGGKNRAADSYKLKMDSASFERVFDTYYKGNIDTFSKSNYANSIIKRFGFIAIYNIVKRHMADQRFKKIASQSILNHPEFLKEIQRYPDSLRKNNEHLDDSIMAYTLSGDNLIGLMRNFDAIDAVTFYRNNIKNTYGELIREFAGERLPESLKKFLDLDIYLSPFTSFPVNDPIQLFFARPFERLYDDVYLIDESDYEKFIQRAYLFYSNFGEMLCEGVYSLVFYEEFGDLDKWQKKISDQTFDYGARRWISENFRTYADEKMKYYNERLDSLTNDDESARSMIKASIYRWNFTLSRIDSLTNELDYRGNRKGSGKYHIFNDNGVLRVIDLETNDDIYNPSRPMKTFGDNFLSEFLDSRALVDNRENLNRYLRPCMAFVNEMLGSKFYYYEDLLDDFKLKLSKARLSQRNRKLQDHLWIKYFDID